MPIQAEIADLRNDVIAYCQKIKKLGGRIVDVGGSVDPWAAEILDALVDVRTPESWMKNRYPDALDRYNEHKDHIRFWKIDICNPFTWPPIEKYVEQHGKYEYAICTQTLEHVLHPQLALEFLSRIARGGFVGVPNKKTELKRGVHWGRPYCGFGQHRWIYTVQYTLDKGYDELFPELWAFPKLNFLEYVYFNEKWFGDYTPAELSIYWQYSIPFQMIQDSDLDFPNPDDFIPNYVERLKAGI